ncbi:VanZ family protein [Salipaludibacillus daqingensis]|uniref:VanZ family protein n=1 Tax=Salipaludibacillus daqingensis TaxID=3041001 RepID=UPI002474ED52|nr:VanZ family protein [Salipaludibacillus daqingensis]
MGNKKSKKNVFKFPTSLVIFMFILYMSVLFYVTFFAWNYGSSFGPVGPGGRNYNLDPFLSIYRIAVYSEDLVDPIRILVGNVVLFIPFGLLFSLLIERLRRKVKPTSIILTVFVSILLSSFIELNQYLYTFRVANIDDVILNTTGGLIGAILYRILRFLKAF